MVITDIRMNKVDKEFSNVVANCSVSFDKQFVVHNIAIVKKKNKENENDKDYYISFPSRKDTSGEFKNLCHPIDKEFRKYVDDEIIKYYKENKDNID